MIDEIHYPNPETYRPWLGVVVNSALIRLAIKENSEAMRPLGVSDYLEKMIAHWWANEFPDEPPPFITKRYDEDILYNPLKS